mmetsp:Transcript_48895/g.153578  ORF Transcript_48895/g.153578 Transcript_48895/m.153578 type:complete len:145 (-) Transcript_48895:658-1092(-)
MRRRIAAGIFDLNCMPRHRLREAPGGEEAVEHGVSSSRGGSSSAGLGVQAKRLNRRRRRSRPDGGVSLSGQSMAGYLKGRDIRLCPLRVNTERSKGLRGGRRGVGGSRVKHAAERFCLASVGGVRLKEVKEKKKKLFIYFQKKI